MDWTWLLLTINVVVALLVWLGRNDWSHKYLRRVVRLFRQHMPGHRTELILQEIKDDLRTSSGGPLREAIDHLCNGMNGVQGSLAMISVRQRMFDKILANATITTDGDGKLIWASQDFLDLAGVSLDEIQRHGWIAAIHQDDREMVVSEWKHAVEDQRDFVLRYRYRPNERRGELQVEAHAYAARITPGGPPVGWVAIVRPLGPPQPTGVSPEPRVGPLNMRLDAERRCYRPPDPAEET